jgi:hypothetical protein
MGDASNIEVFDGGTTVCVTQLLKDDAGRPLTAPEAE